MSYYYGIGITFVMAITLFIGTVSSIGWLVMLASILIGLVNLSLILYLGMSLLSLYGLTAQPKEHIGNINLSREEIEESSKLLDNPFIPRVYNLGVLSTFFISFAHIGTTVFSLSIFMMILYVSIFICNRKLVDLLYNLTLD